MLVVPEKGLGKLGRSAKRVGKPPWRGSKCAVIADCPAAVVASTARKQSRTTFCPRGGASNVSAKVSGPVRVAEAVSALATAVVTSPERLDRALMRVDHCTLAGSLAATRPTKPTWCA